MIKDAIKTMAVVALIFVAFDRALDVIEKDPPNIEAIRVSNIQRQVLAAEQQAKFFKARQGLKKVGLYDQ